MSPIKNLPKGLLPSDMAHPLDDAEMEVMRIAMDEKASGAEEQDMSLFLGGRQERFEDALRLGVLSDARFHNIAIRGIQGNCLSSIEKRIRALIGKEVQRAKSPLCDWLYLYNFEDPLRPVALSLKAGRGREVVAEMERLFSALREAIPLALNGGGIIVHLRRAQNEFEEWCRKEDRILGQFADDCWHLMSGSLLQRDIKFARKSFRIISDSEKGNASGEMSDEEYDALSDKEKDCARALEKNLLEFLSAVVHERNTCAVKLREATEEIQRHAANEAISRVFADCSFTGDEAGEPLFARWMDNLKKYTVKSYEIFLKQDEDGESEFDRLIRMRDSSDPFLPWRANLFVENAAKGENGTPEIPIIAEQITSVQDLAGNIRQVRSFASAHTNHTLLSPGVLARANGGFLILQAEDVLSVPGAWHFLRRSLKSGRLSFETALTLNGLPEANLSPMPIPLHARVILCGERWLFSLLEEHDAAFADIFRVRAEVMPYVERIHGHIAGYARWAKWRAGQCHHLPLSPNAAGALIEYAERLCERRGFLSTKLALLETILEEAAYEADNRGASSVAETHVRAALRERVWRSGVVQEQIQRGFKEKTFVIAVTGNQVGAINCLAVYDTGDQLVGVPTRITCVASAGSQSIVNIIRTAGMGNKVFAKADMTVQGLLAHMFARDVPLALKIALSFEQTYSRVGGDSASIAEYLAILSSIAGVPLNQGIAVTGSLSLLGDVQAVGGVNEKIEGFFDTCKIMGGLSGSQGVIIPHQNKINLMLRPDVAEAAGKGEFHVWAITALEEAVEILTGMDSADFYKKVREQLRKFSEEPEDDGESSDDGDEE